MREKKEYIPHEVISLSDTGDIAAILIECSYGSGPGDTCSTGDGAVPPGGCQTGIVPAE